jgi:hypothetical protein
MLTNKRQESDEEKKIYIDSLSRILTSKIFFQVNRLVSPPFYLFDINIHYFVQLVINMERVTFKIEIPFTDHAHCIGRQGNQIQSIMLATNTHIHFPDENRQPNGTKSNQVSITGTIISIEQARKRIKDILPMSLKFPIPSNHLINDDYPLFKNVRTRFGVIVLARSYVKTGDIYCIVRGLYV